MPRWTKESALTELDRLIQESKLLKKSERGSAAHTRWLVRTLEFLEQVFGHSSIYYRSFRSLRWYQTGSYVIQAFDIQGAIDQTHHEAYLRDLETAKGLLQAASDKLTSTTVEEVYQGKDSGPETSGIVKVLNLVEQKLRKVIRNKPKREKEIQDALESLLIGADIPYFRETDSIEYSSKTYIPDFSLIRLDPSIEVKICVRQEREKEVIAEINDDILAYKQKYGNVMFVIYDTGFIRDTDRFIRHFENQEGIIVRVVKH